MRLHGDSFRLEYRAGQLDTMKGLYLCTRALMGLAALAFVVTPTLAVADDFRLFTETVRVPDLGQVTNYVLATEGRRFVFVPPPKWSVKSDSENKTVHLLPEDLRAGINFKIKLEQNSEKPELKPEQLREEILERYPGAAITNEFKCYISGAEGIVFDVRRLVQQKTMVSSRIAFVAFGGGRVEFELTANAERIADYHFVFGALLSSFRIGPSATKPPISGQAGGIEMMNGTKPYGASAERKEDFPEWCGRRAAILAAGSAGILACRTLGRQGCRPNRQAGSLPYVPLPFDRRPHFEVFARQVVAVQSDGVRLRTSRLTRALPPSQNCGGWTLAPPKMQIEIPGAWTACNPPGCRYNG